MEQRRQLAITAVLVAAVLFGTTGTMLARGPDGITPLGAGTVRLIVGGASLFAIVRLRRDAPIRWRRWWPSIIAGGVAVAVYQLLFFQATTRAGVALGTVATIASGPLFSGAIETVRTRRPPSIGWMLGTSTAIGGVLLLGLVGRATTPDVLGVLAALGSGLGWAVYATIGKWQIDRGMPSTTSMATMFSTAGLLCAPLLLVEPLGWLTTGSGVALALYLGVVTIGIAYTMYGIGLRSLTAPTVITLTLAEPITAAVLAAVVLDEVIGWTGAVGIALVGAGLVITATVRLDDRF
jgi:drug/metabolite transporter, DME family